MKPNTNTTSKEDKAKQKAKEEAAKAAAKEKAAKEAEKLKAQAEARGMKIMVAAKAGEKIAEAVAHDMLGNLSKAMKGKFVMEGQTLKLAKGAKPTEADFSQVLGALSNLKGAATEAADQAGFYMADAITLANEAGFDGNQLLEQVAKEFGVKLFTAQQAQRVGEFFPPEKRIPGLSMSGHQEIMYGAGAVKDKAKLEAVIEKIAQGKPSDEPTLNGKPEVRPFTKSEVRKLMDEVAGKKPTKPKAKGGAAGTPSGNFLYLTKDKDDYDVFYISDDLSLKACASPEFSVVDLLTMSVLDPKGNPEAHIEQLPAEWFEEEHSGYIPKTKKEKKAKAEPTPEPEAELVPAGAEDDGMPPV